MYASHTKKTRAKRAKMFSNVCVFMCRIERECLMVAVFSSFGCKLYLRGF